MAKLSLYNLTDPSGIPSTRQLTAEDADRYKTAGFTVEATSTPLTGMEGSEPTGAAGQESEKDARIAELEAQLAAAKSATPANKAGTAANK